MTQPSMLPNNMNDAHNRWYDVYMSDGKEFRAMFDALNYLWFVEGNLRVTPQQAAANGWRLDIPSPTLQDLMEEISTEVAAAEAKWPSMNSAHEAYAVLLEEVDELWDHVKTSQKKRDPVAMRKEALQVAAMAVRFIRDVIDGGRILK